MLSEFSTLQLVFVALIFIWSGFSRSGLGFGGASLSLPLLLLIYNQPIYWIPIIALQMLFFSALTLRTRWDNIDWAYLGKTSKLIVPGAIAGVFGLIKMPNEILLIIIYSVTLLYSILWILNKMIKSQSIWLDRALLLFGGYVSGATLSGAALITAVFMQNVEKMQLRSTLFIVWTIIVSIKLTTLVAYQIPLNIQATLYLLPAASIGHLIGIKAHEYILQRTELFTRVVGSFLLLVCLAGFWKLWQDGIKDLTISFLSL